MRKARTILQLIRKRGLQKLPLERVYRLLYNPDLYLMAYGKIYRNHGAMTAGVNGETADGMSLAKINIIIEKLRFERYRWQPARRTYLARKDGKKRPLGIQVWSDKLLQEVIRLILDAYYDPSFSNFSHGFRPGRGCHTALQQIYHQWVGTTWFIEGDISKCFENLDHDLIESKLRQDIKDERFIRLISQLLRAGYLEEWRYQATYSGAPQGSILSPLLSNLLLDKLDKWVETELIPQYTRGERRRSNPQYEKLHHKAYYQTIKGRVKAAKELWKQVQHLPSQDPKDPDYRRLRYCRYADDFLLGFIGPGAEAEEIKRRIGEFLPQELRLELSQTKTLITHARTERAKFLNYEIHTIQENTRRDGTGRRSVNGNIGLRVPKTVIQAKCQRFKGHSPKVLQRTELINDTDFSIINLYRSEFRGLVEYYRLAYNLHSLTRLDDVMEISLTKTLAAKFKLSVPKIYQKYQAKCEVDGRLYKILEVAIERPGKKPLVARWGDISLKWDIKATVSDEKRFFYWPPRTELVKRLLANKCEYCGASGQSENIQVHHIRALKDLEKYPGREKPGWVAVMAARRRKTLVLCESCHQDVTYGRPLRRRPMSASG